MECRKVIEILERLAPIRLACDWDNPGLLAGRASKEVKKAYIALDATDEAVEAAIGAGADMLITHHPLIFRPVKQVNDTDPVTRRLVRLIQADVSYYAMHTNFDIAPGCMADLASERLGLEDEQPLEVTGELDGEPVGIGKVGNLPQAMAVEGLARLVKERFGIPAVTLHGALAPGGMVTRVAISPGAGGSMVAHGLCSGAQVLVTGDISHHDGLDAAAGGMAVIDAGHYGLEHLFVPFVARYLRGRADGLEAVEAPLRFPVSVI